MNSKKSLTKKYRFEKLKFYSHDKKNSDERLFHPMCKHAERSNRTVFEVKDDYYSYLDKLTFWISKALPTFS